MPASILSIQMLLVFVSNISRLLLQAWHSMVSVICFMLSINRSMSLRIGIFQSTFKETRARDGGKRRQVVAFKYFRSKMLAAGKA